MNEFKTYHPIVNFTYFVLVIGFSCFFMHPICLGISLMSAVTYSAMLKGKTNLLYLLPMMLATALLNPAFNHEGVTVLAYLPSGNPLTLESVVYGLCAAVMLASVISHFTCYSEVMTSDKFLYLFGKVIPSLALIFSMTLGFVPRFIAQVKGVTAAQRGLDPKKSRIRLALTILSATTTWALENSIDTADSMKARGYGLPGRSTFSVFKFDRRDRTALIYLLFLGGYLILGGVLGCMDFRFFPSLKSASFTPFGISVFLAYFLLCINPIIIELWEVRKWNALRSKP